MKALREPLSVDQIDFRVQSISLYGKATILAYKDARVDMMRLDEAVGPLNWKREHCKDNHNCIVSIWCEDKKQWISKEDTGTESYTEAEKGLASDSFKRACFNWGIGRELYDYPRISIQLLGNGEGKGEDEWRKDGNKGKAHYGLRLREWRWFTDFDDKGQLTMLLAKDQNGKIRYEWRNIAAVSDTAAAIKLMIANESWEELAEAWGELEQWEELLLNTAKTKGGFFSTEEKSLIKAKLYEINNVPGEQAA